MARRRRFGRDEVLENLRNIPEDVSEFEDSGSEFDDSYTPELDSDSSSSDESEQAFSDSFSSGPRLSDRPPKRRRIQNQLEATEVSQEIDDIDSSVNVSQNEEENDQNIELAPDTSQSELPSSDVDEYDDAAENRGIILTAPDGTEWLQMTPGDYSAGRRSQQNILKEASGPTPYAKRNVFAGSPASAWRLLIDNFILKHITKCTVTEAHRQPQNQTFALTVEELEAFIAVMYARGVAGKSDLPLHDLWTERWGVPLCKSAISRNRFCEILRFLRFDMKSNRSQRLQTDKFALFSEVWNQFIDNCQTSYKPGAFITVDEQLFPSKARCPFTQFMASKPDKFGQKYWLAVDKESKYLINGFPYVGKDATRSENDRVSDRVVMQLMGPYLNKGRNVTTDNYFTSVKLATQLKEKQTSLLGTVNKIRREVPSCLKKMKEELHSCKLYKSGDITLTVYQGKVKKHVLILSTMHKDITIADNEKKTPETVSSYNETKYGVDILDQMAKKYTCRTGTRRWPIHSFQNTLDFAAINAWVLYKEITNENISRRDFIRTLAEELAEPQVQKRNRIPGQASLDISNEREKQPKKFCQVKILCKRNRSVGVCTQCKKSLCGTCTALVQRVCKKCTVV